MSKNWWYVEGSERKGPVEEETLRSFLDLGKLKSDSYIWTKGFDNWMKFEDVAELAHLFRPEVESIPDAFPGVIEEPLSFDDKLDLSTIGENERVFYIKTGIDRKTKETGAEYGPFSLDQLSRLFEENRINEKTYIFTTGMETWSLLADFDLVHKISGGKNISVEEKDRRNHIRKPFIANMYFHDQAKLYEGVCRDISIGGMQVLVSNFPGSINEEVTMNVHPENSEYCFVATGKIVRILDGNSGFSLRFNNIGKDAISAINNYLETN